MTYRYDGTDEDGGHWLEEVEIGPDGEETFTERYVPVQLYAGSGTRCQRCWWYWLCNTVEHWMSRVRGWFGKEDGNGN